MLKFLNTTKAIGDHYEQIALNHLKAQNLHLITRNYQCKHGEIDIIMTDSNILSFIEVRFRKNQGHGGALASITINKQRKIRHTAEHFLINNKKYQNFTCRFDVVAISEISNKHEINWITSAFI